MIWPWLLLAFLIGGAVGFFVRAYGAGLEAVRIRKLYSNMDEVLSDAIAKEGEACVETIREISSLDHSTSESMKSAAIAALMRRAYEEEPSS